MQPNFIFQPSNSLFQQPNFIFQPTNFIFQLI